MRTANKTICVIPARMGSKRLKFKNISKIDGHPVIAYTILEARKSGLFDKVYVATESQKIANIAKKYGATVPCLVPKNLAGDKVQSWVPCGYIIDYLKESQGLEFENILCLQPTSVLKQSIDIKNGMKAFLKNKNDFLVSVTPLDPHYFHWAMIEDKDDWRMYFRKVYLKERHFLPPVFRPNGAIKIAKIDKLKKIRFFFGKNLGVSLMPEERSIHIVSQYDLQIAEMTLKSRKKHG